MLSSTYSSLRNRLLSCSPTPQAGCSSRARTPHVLIDSGLNRVRRRTAHLRAAPAGQYGCGSGSGGDGGTRKPTSFGTDGPEPGHQSKKKLGWLRTLAVAFGGYVVLGLLEPWTLLQHRTPIDTSQQTVAVIVPVLNESAAVVATLQHLHQLSPPMHEVIVVDGGSTDDTVKLVKRSGLASRVLKSQRGRACQMNAGAEAATADLLCFLHADTLPPNDLVSIMRRELSDPRVVLGGFSPSIEIPGQKLHMISFHNLAKTYYGPMLFRPVAFLRGMRILFGDQAMFCRAIDFRAVGGFDTKLAIMEDADLCIRMHGAGPTSLQQVACSSSSSSSCSQVRDATMQVQREQSGSKEQPMSVFSHLQQSWQQFLQPRGRIKQVLDRECVTSGRRIAAWGSLKATYIHVVIALNWYLGMDSQNLKELYHRMYTDNFR